MYVTIKQTKQAEGVFGPELHENPVYSFFSSFVFFSRRRHECNALSSILPLVAFRRNPHVRPYQVACEIISIAG